MQCKHLPPNYQRSKPLLGLNFWWIQDGIHHQECCEDSDSRWNSPVHLGKYPVITEPYNNSDSSRAIERLKNSSYLL